MLNKPGPCVLLMCAVVVGVSDAAYAQRQVTRQAPSFRTSDGDARHSVNFTIGRFFPRAEDARVDRDVLLGNLDFPQFLDFEIDDFRSYTFGIEWLFPIGNHVEMGPGVGFSQRTVTTNYSIHVEEIGPNTFDEIPQDLSLRVMPFSFTARVVPVPPSSPVHPYVGAGVALLQWRYRESGEFILFADDPVDGDCLDDGDDCRIFETAEGEPFESKGWKLAPVFLAGVRVAGRSASVGVELRYQKAEAELLDDDGEPSTDFYGDMIDLGGWTFQGTFGVRF